PEGAGITITGTGRSILRATEAWQDSQRWAVELYGSRVRPNFRSAVVAPTARAAGPSGVCPPPTMTAREQLDAVLGNLYDFGDDFVTREEQVPVRGQSKEPSEDKESYKVNGRVEDQQAVVCSKRGKKTVSVFFDSIKDELSSQAKTPVMSATSVPQPSAVEVVSFLSHKGKKRSQDQHLRGMYIEVLLNIV
ncbi:hypothetical protein GDO78_016034, partial [Eleutherodactylus coqui]